MEREKYLSLFIDESRENLLALNEYLLELEKGAGDLKLMNDIFRVAHTLKGMASTMGFKEISELTHEMENLLDFLRNAQLAVTSEIIDVLFSCLDSLDLLVDNVSSQENIEIDTTSLMKKLKKLIKIGSGESEPENNNKISIGDERTIYSIEYEKEEKDKILEAIENGYKASEIEVLLMKDCVMKSIRVLLVIQAIEKKSKIIKCTPSREDLNNEKFGRSFVITIIHSDDIEEIKDSVMSIAEVMKVYIEDLSNKFQSSSETVSKSKETGSMMVKYSDTEANVLVEAINQKFKCFEIYVSLMPNTLMKSIRASMVMTSLNNLGCQVIKSVPSGNELSGDNVPDTFILTIVTEKTEEEIKKAILAIAEISQTEILEIFKGYLTPEEFKTKKTLEKPEFNDYEKVVIEEAELSGKRALLIGVNLMHGTIMKFARYILVSRKLEQFGEIIKTIPAPEEIESENFENSFQVVFLTSADDKTIKNVVSSVAEITNIVDLIPVFPTNKKVLENINKEQAIETIKNMSIEKLIETIEHETTNKSYNITKNDKEINDSIQQSKSKKAILKKQTIRVDIERLDELINLIEEVVILKSSLNKISLSVSSPELTQSVRILSMISTNLQNNAMKLRMIPVENIFNRFPRMIRDVAKSLNKEIEFVMEGEETELDRTIIDEIGDPLVHLLRNSIDHGIENYEDRIKAGKNKVGKISLIARHEGNNVLIIVEDDGGGINVDRVKSKAIEKKLISKEQASYMTEEELLNLIFLAGLSTVDVTTDISGRGVGMDAVLSKVKSIGGKISVFSEKGKGSRFTIKLPLTLAIMEVLLVGVQDETYAIPISYIEEVKELSETEIKNINQVKVTVIRDKTIPLVDLKEKLEVPNSTKEKDYIDPDIYTPCIPVVIVRTEEGNKTSGLIVDYIIGQEDVVIKPLGKLALDQKSYVSGTANLGDGNLALILNITNIT